MNSFDSGSAFSTNILQVGDVAGFQPTTKRGRQTYDAVLEAATREFARSDYHEVSVERIAKVAKVSVGTIYRYFANKEGLFLVVLTNCLGEMFDAARRVWSEPYSYLENLQSSTANYLRTYVENRFVLSAAEQLAITSVRVRELMWFMRNQVNSAMANRLRQDQSETDPGSLDVEILIRSLTAMVDGYAHRAYVDIEFGRAEFTTTRIEDVAQVLSEVWYRSVYGSEAASNR